MQQCEHNSAQLSRVGPSSHPCGWFAEGGGKGTKPARDVPMSSLHVAMSHRHVRMRETLARVRREAANCRRCPLCKNATQTVFGEGPARAQKMLVGEQPGSSSELTTLWIAVHPSYLLRLPDATSRKAEFARFVKDLATAKAWLAARSRAAAQAGRQRLARPL